MPEQPIAPEAAALPAPARWLLLALAWLCLGLAILGVFLPLLPTVPFLLLAAWAAARSSPRLSAWLEGHPRFGPHLRDWRRAGVVRRRSKWQATAVMATSAVLVLLLVQKTWAAATAIACMATVLCWLWLRPEQPPQESAGQ
ncbi:YbaN family protein [uncultured Ramlibacter sp.]|uniref:YbaN family protein n=1 Tax=uncultured Ramlibacter sp. TaxID=260755 RepID=UPI00345C387C